MIVNFKFLFWVFFLGFTQASFSQITGRITNLNDEPLQSAIIKIDQSAIGAKSDVNGEYKLNVVAPGTYQIIVSSIGYQKETMTIVYNGSPLQQNFKLTPTSSKVKAVKIKGQKNKATEAYALEEQKKSTQVIEIMSAQEMSRKGAGDAQAAVVKMAGISKDEGSNQIYVRGLGDRYNSTMLNGMFLPSDNPEYKNISLEYFPIEIIQNIEVSKTYNKFLLGDFGGATVNITSKEYTGKPFISGGYNIGFNSQSISRNNVGSGVGLLGNVSDVDYPTLTQGAFVARDWNRNVRSIPSINQGFSLNGGWSKNFNEKVRLSIFSAASISNKFQYFQGMNQVLDAQENFRDSSTKESYTYSVNQNAMLNAVLTTSPKFKSKLNYLLYRTAANQNNTYTGVDGNNRSNTLRIRNVNDISTLHIIQSLNEIKISDNVNLILNGSFNAIINDQPNRLTQSYIENNNRWEYVSSASQGVTSSYYQKLNDKDYTASATLSWILSKDENNIAKSSMDFGYVMRYKDREFNQLDYIFFLPDPRQVPTTLSLPTDANQVFVQQNLGSLFLMRSGREEYGKVVENFYTGNLMINSPSLSYENRLTEKLSLACGLRLDVITQEVAWNVNSTFPQKGKVPFDDWKLLPYLNLKMAVNPKTNLKFGFSKTYTIPQFKELAPFLYDDISTFNSRGNPNVYTSDNYNLDLKYEFYPSKSDLISVAGFGKVIFNPITKSFEANTGQLQMTYINSGDQAILFGGELEVKKTLLNTMSSEDSNLRKEALSVGFNTSILYSRQDLNNDKVRAENRGYTSTTFTETSAPLQGASPFLVNFDLSYKRRFGKYEPQATVLLSYFHDRLYAIGSQAAKNTYERGFVTLDIITKHQFSKKFSMSLNLRNILNPTIERYQEFAGDKKIVVSSYQRGMDLSAGLNYNF